MANNDILRKFSQPLTELIVDTQTYADLRRTLLFHLNEELGNIVAPSEGFQAVAFETVQWAWRHGKMIELAKAVASEVPGRDDAAALVRDMENRDMENAVADAPTDNVRPTPPPPDKLLGEFSDRRLAWDRERGSLEVLAGRQILESVGQVLAAVIQAKIKDIPRDEAQEFETVVHRIGEIKSRVMFLDGGKSVSAFWTDGDALLEKASRSLEQFRIGAS
jgi:hypothetical protein